MAGHSKWANIQHRKNRQDAKRGKAFTKLIKEITVAARMGGGDLSFNPRLRLAIEKAKAENMPSDNIKSAVKRGTGELDGVNYEEIRYEGYGINGAAVIVDCLTDNRTRTVADVRHAFTKHGGNLGTDGSVAFMFKHCGHFFFAPGTSEDQLMEAALEAGAEDIVSHDDGSIEIISDRIETPDGKKKRIIDKHIYHLSMCTFCGLCIKTCPSNALAWGQQFEHAVFDRSKLTKVLNKPGSTILKDIE